MNLRVLMIVCMAVALVVACANRQPLNRSAPGTPTVASTAATPSSPMPTPAVTTPESRGVIAPPPVGPATWDRAPASGISAVDAIVAAIIRGDVAGVTALLGTTDLLCTAPGAPPSERGTGLHIPAFLWAGDGRSDWFGIAPGGTDVDAVPRLVQSIVGTDPRLGAVVRPLTIVQVRTALTDRIEADYLLFIAQRDLANDVRSDHLTFGAVIFVRGSRIVGLQQSGTNPLTLKRWYEEQVRYGTVVIAPPR